MGKPKAVTRIPEDDEVILKLIENEKNKIFNIPYKKIDAKLPKKEKRLGCRNEEYWKIRGYSNIEAKILALSRMPGNYEYYRIFKLQSREESILNANKASREKAVTLENFKKRWGQEEGNKKWKSYIEKQRIKNTFEYKHQQFGWNETDFERFNLSRASTLENFKKRWGQEEGNKKWELYKKRQAYTKSKEYFMEKYGIDDGIKIFNEINTSKSHSFESYLKKYGDFQLATEKYNEFLNLVKPYSDVSIELFDSLFHYLPKNSVVLYATKNHEKQIKYIKTNKTYNVDFYYQLKNKIKIIEFYGDYWHCNPKIFIDPDKLIKIGFSEDSCRKVKDVWDCDTTRETHLKEIFGDDNVLIVWESEYNSDKDKCIKKCLQFIGL